MYDVNKNKKYASIIKLLTSSTCRFFEFSKTSPFSLATDGSTDYDDVKLYPVVLRFVDYSTKRVTCLLLRLTECKASTGKEIFQLMDQELSDRIPWKNCISFAADNAAVIQGSVKGVVTYISQKQPSVYTWLGVHAISYT